MIFEKIDPKNLDQAKAYVSWYHGPTMIDNWTLQTPDGPSVTNDTIEDFKNQFSEKEDAPEKHSFMLKCEGEYIGCGQFYINHRMCMTKEGRVCWPSLAIGDPRWRGFLSLTKK